MESIRKKIYAILLEQLDIKYDIQDSEDGFLISAMYQEKMIGYIKVNFDYDPAWRIEDEIGEDERVEKIFPEGKTAVIEWLKVDPTHLRMGIGRELIKKAIETIEEHGYYTIYLNASPFGGVISVQNLSSLYKSFGFKTLFDQGHNIQMIKYI
jgi:ribosomal protein S18 acetylase RimI-like enzyme